MCSTVLKLRIEENFVIQVLWILLQVRSTILMLRIEDSFLQNVQQELSAREPTVTTMKAPGNLPHSQHEELSQLWERVTYLCEVRENKLTDALKLVSVLSYYFLRVIM